MGAFKVILRGDGTANKSATVRAAFNHLIEIGELEPDAPMPDRVHAVRQFLHWHGHADLEKGTNSPYMMYAQALKGPRAPAPTEQEQQERIDAHLRRAKEMRALAEAHARGIVQALLDMGWTVNDVRGWLDEIEHA